MAAPVDVSEPNQVEQLEIGIVEDTDRELYARWVYGVANTDSFSYQFDYLVDIDSAQIIEPKYSSYAVDEDQQWFIGTESTVKYSSVISNQYKNSLFAVTYSPPETATRVRFRVKPVAKKHEVNGKNTPYYTSKWSSWVYVTLSNYVDHTPAKPSAPTVEVTETHVQVYVDTYDPNTKYVKFQLVKNDSELVSKTWVEVKMNRAITWLKHPTGGVRYKIQAFGYYKKVGNTYKIMGPGSEYSEDFGIHLPPNKPSVFSGQLSKLMNASTVQLFWEKALRATAYDVEYTTNPSYFDSSEEVQSIEVQADGNSYTYKNRTYNHCEIVGLTYQPSTKYYFRVRSKNDVGESEWNIKWPYFSITTGIKPNEPTTWSERSVLAVGDKIYLYWTHNSEDGSKQTSAQVNFEFDKQNPLTRTVDGNKNYLVIDPDTEQSGSRFRTITDGMKVTWRVRTMGILTGDANYSPWSTWREITFHTSPSVSMSMYYGSGAAYHINGYGFKGRIYDGGLMRMFPLYVVSYPSPNTQIPVSFRCSIIANETYETVDNRGNMIYVASGESIYNKFVDDSVWDWIANSNSRIYVHEILPSDVTLEDGISYTCRIEILTDAGLTATNSMEFTTDLNDLTYTPDAEIAIDTESYAAFITPFCTTLSGYKIEELFYNGAPENAGTGVWTYAVTLNKEALEESDIIVEKMEEVDPSNFNYTMDGDSSVIYDGIFASTLSFKKGTAADKATTDKNEKVTITCSYDGDQTLSFTLTKRGNANVTSITNFNVVVQYQTSEQIQYSEFGDREEHVPGFIYKNRISSLADNVFLSVYRRAVDGEFIEIDSDIPNDGISTITDPHPALDYARYRVVARSEDSGGLTYYDVPNYPINAPYIVIQWDEQWRDFSAVEESGFSEPIYSGSRIVIPGNIDVSNSFAPDVSMIEYIGREHPVAYHGTQIGETASWSCAIPRDDVETLSAVRRLARWMGVCYVREPSGSGFWATVGVSFSQTHSEVIIPITFNITRTEGGM